MVNDFEVDCPTACWVKYNIINPSYDLGYYHGQGGQSEQEDMTATMQGTQSFNATVRR